MKAEYGYMGKMLFVDLTNRKIHEEDLSEELARSFIGGYGVGARIIIERMKAGQTHLDPTTSWVLELVRSPSPE